MYFKRTLYRRPFSVQRDNDKSQWFLGRYMNLLDWFSEKINVPHFTTSSKYHFWLLHFTPVNLKRSCWSGQEIPRTRYISQNHSRAVILNVTLKANYLCYTCLHVWKESFNRCRQEKYHADIHAARTGINTNNSTASLITARGLFV